MASRPQKARRSQSRQRQLLLNDTDPNGDPLSVVAVGSQLGGTVSLASNAVTFTPTPGYIGAASFTYQITDGPHTSVPATVELTVLPAPTTAQLFAYTDAPANLSDPDTTSVNLGVKFDSSQSGLVTGLKYYKGIGDTGTHVGSLWTSDGTLLASATFTNETASGWQYVTFANPVAITAGTTYVASYSSNGHYASTGNFFTTEYTNGILSTSGPDASVYTYGAGNLFPTSVVDCELLGGCPGGSAGRGKRCSRRSRRTAAATTAAVSIAENTTAVTTVTATDPDAGQTLSYSIVGGADAAKFTINATTGALAFVTAPNFEAPTDAGANNVYDVTVQVSDGNGGIDTQAIAVTVTNQNEVPTITSNGGGDTAAVSIAENTTAVTTVTATDPDAGQTLTYSIVGGADAGQVHDQRDDGRARLRDGPELRGADRLRAATTSTTSPSRSRTATADRHSSHCGHGDQPERGPDDHVERRRRHGGGRRLPRTPRR